MDGSKEWGGWMDGPWMDGDGRMDGWIMEGLMADHWRQQSVSRLFIEM